MSQPVIVTIHAFSSGEPGYGGWAYVTDEGGALAGAAGGARAVGPQAMLLAALAAALAKIDAAQSVTVRANLPLEGEGLAGRAGAIRFERRGDPFLKAWADEGQKQAKTRGTFQAAIPKPNLKAFKP